MEIGNVSVKNFQVLIIDNFFSPNELDLVFNECLFLCDDEKLKSAKETGSATHKDRLLKNNKGLFLQDVYLDQNISDILFFNKKMLEPNFVNHLISFDVVYRYIRYSNRLNTLLSYYENDDYYEPHCDESKITAITWLFKTPKLFSGGDLIIENEWQIKCMDNRTVIFPSILQHEVTKVEMQSENIGTKSGRFSITTFIE
jgi:hypothetical protein